MSGGRTVDLGGAPVAVHEGGWTGGERSPYRKTYRLKPGQSWLDAESTEGQFEHLAVVDDVAVPVGVAIARDLLRSGARWAYSVELWGKPVLLGPDLVCAAWEGEAGAVLDELVAINGGRYGGIPDVVGMAADGTILLREAKNIAARDRIGPKQHEFARLVRAALGDRVDLAIVEWGRGLPSPPAPARRLTLTVWNAAGRFREKAAWLLDSCASDVVIVSECESVQELRRSSVLAGCSMAWFGSDPRRGLAVVGRDGWRVRLADAVYSDLPVIAPFDIWHETARPHDVAFSLLAVWADNSGSRRPLREALVRYEARLCSRAVIVAGDFNDGTQWHGQRRNSGGFADVVAALAAHGLVSAYHVANGLDVDSTDVVEEPTFWMSRNGDRPYHLDHIFLPEAIIDRGSTDPVRILSHEQVDRRSDHAPVTVDLVLEACDAT